jgi:hypothetical protein
MEQNTSDCTHEAVAEKALVGTWVVDEVRLAVDKVYQLIQVYEIYDYEVTQYDPATGDGGAVCSIHKHVPETEGRG